MRSIAMVGALAVLAAVPIAAQGFRTGEAVNPARRVPTTSGSVLGGVLGGQLPDTAQQRRKSDRIPRGQLPPAGMCRIWIDGVPPGQQPAPTDCQSAVATKPANARVIWGDETAFPGKGKGKGKVKQEKQKEDRNRGDDRDDDDRDDQLDRERVEKHGRGKSLEKRDKKG